MVLLETHDYWRSSPLVREVARRVDHPSFGVLWDFMHTQRVFEEPEESMAMIGSLARHVHAHDGRLTDDGKLDLKVKLGDGDFDHATPLNLLKKAGFNGWVSVEVIHKPGSEHDPDAVLSQYGEKLRSMV